jgi:mono/diheme cytochrome c family protein
MMSAAVLLALVAAGPDAVELADLADLPTCAPWGLARQREPVLAAERGQRIVGRAQCGRCHALPGSGGRAPAARERSCAGCHAWIHDSLEDPGAAAEARRRFPLWDRYQKNVRSFLAVPDLAASAGRLDEAFLARYLRAPFKVRPALGEEMIRTGLDEGDAAAAASWLAAAARRERRPSELADRARAIPLSRAAADVAAGAIVFERLACRQCHALGNRPAFTSAVPGPDLALVRERMRPDTVAAFIADPPSLGGQPIMPRYPIDAVQAARLRDFLWASAAIPPSPSSFPSPCPSPCPELATPVSYATIRREILDVTCIHCHMDARRNGGEGGPGNTGGLGYRGAELDLESWAGIVRGARDETGRHSILVGCRGEEAPLLARLRARTQEHDRERAGPAAVRPGGPPGMPLGLRPLTPARFQLLLTWLAQGAPGPDGKPAPATCAPTGE